MVSGIAQAPQTSEREFLSRKKEMFIVVRATLSAQVRWGLVVQSHPVLV